MTGSSSSSGRGRAFACLGAGVLLFAAYIAWLIAQPRGLVEFSYAPFTPEPLPYSPMRGFTYEQLWGHVARFLLVTPALALVSWAIARLVRPAAPVALRPWLLAVCSVSLLITSAVMLGILRGRATVDDELVYRMQATFLSEGRLASSELGFVPPDVFTIRTRAGYTGKYLPGEAIVQVPGVLAGIPALLHLPLFALTLFAWHRALLERAGARVAELGTIALALSPMVMLTTATGLSQATSLCAVALAGLGFEWARGRHAVAGAVLLALAVAFGFATRPQSMFPVGLVLVPWAALALARRRRFAGLLSLGLLLAAGFSAVGAYNAALSGSPFTLPWYLQCTIERFGFGRVWKLDTFEHTPWTALENLAVVLVRLNAWWLGFPFSLGVLGLFLWFGRRAHGAGVWLAVGAAVILFELGYYSPGVSDTGTAYHYELVLPGSLIAASVAHAALERFPSLAVSAIAVHVGAGTVGWLAEQTLRLERLVSAIHEDSDRALARVTRPAILFYETRPSEARSLGWVHEPFPKRFRGEGDEVVTFPRLGRALDARVRAAYPERSCWYFRRDPRTEAAELSRCEEAVELMARVPAEEEPPPLWVRPTAYLVTDFDPNDSNRRRRVRDEQGRPRLACCTVRDLRGLGFPIVEEVASRCVEDGP